MGTYKVLTKEIIRELIDCIDSIEGDFTSSELIDALDFMCYYPHTTDLDSTDELIWKKKCEEVLIG